MNGYILLEGGSEFGGAMAEVDRRAMELAGGADVPIVILPTAAAVDNNQERAGGNGKRWFEGLGATDVRVLPLVDRASADSEATVKAIEGAKLIYMLGGSPDYLTNSLAGSASWQAVLRAHAQGAVVGGSSAGAMAPCAHFYNPHIDSVSAGLALLSDFCVIPHFNRTNARWIERIRRDLPNATLLGIDERTGILNDGAHGEWTVYGAATVVVIAPGTDNRRIYSASESLAL